MRNLNFIFYDRVRYIIASKLPVIRIWVCYIKKESEKKKKKVKHVHWEIFFKNVDQINEKEVVISIIGYGVRIIW